MDQAMNAEPYMLGFNHQGNSSAEGLPYPVPKLISHKRIYSMATFKIP